MSTRRSTPSPALVAAAIALLWGGIAASAPAPAPAPSSGEALAASAVEVLRTRCFQCHGAPRSSGLDLRTRATALAGGKHGKGIVPGKPEEGSVYASIAGTGRVRMPPAGPIPTAERETLRRWIAAGAPWPGAENEQWWAFRELKAPPVPRVRNREWVRNPLDAFVLARLEERGLSPAPPAGRRELIRRVYFDLIGLSPTPEEVEAFVRDTRSDAYERLVDRLLASPHYGERWARHWLDVVRFAESQGFERDKIRDHAWRYRDYVIRAFNSDMPYDRFVREQVAGDVLPGATRESTVATGFLVAGPWDEVGNQQPGQAMKRRVREDELEDMVSATSQTFLGLTVNCARCHDHKFDPIPTRDYYRIQAALIGVKHGDRDLLTQAEREERDAKLKPLRERVAEVEKQVAALDQTGRLRALGIKAASPSEGPPAPPPMVRWAFERGGAASRDGLAVTLSGGASVSEGRLRLDGKDGQARTGMLPFSLAEKTLEAWVALPNLDQRGGSAFTVEDGMGRVFDAIVFGERQLRKWTAGSDGFRRTRDVEAPPEKDPPNRLIHVAISYASDGRIRIYSDGKPYGEPYVPENEPLTRFEAGKSRIVFGLRHSEGAEPGKGRWLRGEIEEARLYDRALTPAEVEASYGHGPPPVGEAELREALTPEERERRDGWTAEVAKAKEEIAAIDAPVKAYAANPEKAGTVKILTRGDIEQEGETVSAGGLSCIPAAGPDFGLGPEAPDAERRLKLASWLTHPKNPLTPRVMVNRVWQYHFGQGLVATPSDFGVSGEKPSHPELLDYLASLFAASATSSAIEGENERKRERENSARRLAPSLIRSVSPSAPQGMAWSVKSLHRLILTSSTYRQSDALNVRAAAVDGENRLLWRMSPRRLEAEEVRDAILSASGALNAGAAGGPGFRPFSVVSANSSFYTPEDRDGPEYNRRSVYRTVVNSGGVPLLEALDCPDPSVKTPRRASTTTPLQALALLNNSFVLRQSREMAARVEREMGNSVFLRVERAYRIALGRSPARAERERGMAFARRNGLAAFCRVLFNSSEFIYVR